MRFIDTAWYYGPEVAHRILVGALSPYPDDLVLVTELGGARSDDGTWYADLSASGLRQSCEHGLRILGLDEMPVTHLRRDDEVDVPFGDALGTMRAAGGEDPSSGAEHRGFGQLELPAEMLF